MKRLSFVLLLAALAVFGLQAPVLSGVWTGTVVVNDTGSGDVTNTPVRLEIEQNGSVISGKIGHEGESEQSPLEKATLEGKTLSFEVHNSEIVGPARFRLTLSGDTLDGEMHAALDSGDITGKVKLTREKK